MPLIAQTVPISLTKGLNTKIDSKQVPAGEMLTLENAYFQTPGKIKKRNAFLPLASNTTLSSGNLITNFENELVLSDNTNIWSYNTIQNSLTNKGVKITTDLSVQSIIRDSYQQTYPDSAIGFGLSVFAWVDSSNGIRYSVFDSATNETILANQLISATGSNPKVKIIGNYFVIIYIDSSTSPSSLYLRSILHTAPTILNAPMNLSGTDPFINYDAQVINNRLYIIYDYVASLSVGAPIKAYDTSLTFINSTNLFINQGILCLFGDTSNNVWAAQIADFGIGSGANIVYSIIDPSFNILQSNILLDSTATGSYTNITGIFYNSVGTFFYEVQNTTGNTYDEFIMTNTGTSSGTAGTPVQFLRSVGLASKAVLFNGLVYLIVIHDSNLQPTYFLVNNNMIICGKIAPGIGGSLNAIGLLPEINILSSINLQFPYLIKDLLSSVNGAIYTQTGVNSANITFNLPISDQILASNLNMSGAFPTLYDGQQVVEQGFVLYPEGGSAIVMPFGGGLGQGSYAYSTTYEWTDAQGQIERSAPSIPITIDTTVKFAGTITSGNTFLTLTTNAYLLYPGMEVSGTGITAGTTITSISGATVNLSTTVGANGNYSFTFIPQTNFVPNQNSLAIPNVTPNEIGLDGLATLNIVGNAVNSSNIVTLISNIANAALKVGMAISSNYGNLTGGTTITAINGNQLTLSHNLSNNVTYQFYQVTNNITGSFSTSSQNITGISSANIAKLSLYQQIVNSNFPRETYITAIGSTSITVSSAATGNGTNANISILFNPRYYFTAGAAISDGNVGIQPDTIVKTIIPGGLATTTYFNNSHIYADRVVLSLNLLTTPGTSGFVTISNTASVLLTGLPTLRLTQKPPTSIAIVVYGTIANGTIYYQKTLPNAPIMNSNIIDSVSFLDNVSDFTAIGNQQLYTTSGEVDNISLPAVFDLTEYKIRLCAITSEDPLTFWYSKQVIAGTPVEFSDLFTIRIDERGGPMTALYQMDDKLIIFKNNNIFYMFGDGPAPNGTSNDFSTPQLVPTDTGCINKRSLILIPQGLMYQSANGIYLLDRGLNVTYIGSPVEAYNSYTITSAKLIPSVTQVRFTLSNGQILVYDYFMQQWSIFTNNNAADSTIFNNLHTYISPSGIINQESIGTFTENGTYIPINLITGWLSFAGLQNFERVRKMLILGDYKSPHTLNISISYDFNDTIIQTTMIPVLNAPLPYYQFRMFFDRQKCDSFKLQIQETQSGTSGEGFSLSNLSLEIGAKVGTNKITAANSYS